MTKKTERISYKYKGRSSAERVTEDEKALFIERAKELRFTSSELMAMIRMREEQLNKSGLEPVSRMMNYEAGNRSLDLDILNKIVAPTKAQTTITKIHLALSSGLVSHFSPESLITWIKGELIKVTEDGELTDEEWEESAQIMKELLEAGMIEKNWIDKGGDR